MRGEWTLGIDGIKEVGELTGDAIDTVECLLCHHKFESLSHFHMIHRHKITLAEYKNQFPDATIMSDKTINKRNRYGEAHHNYGIRRYGKDNPNYGNHPIAWNRGLTKETDARVAKYGQTISASKKGKYSGASNPFYGKKHTEEIRQKMSDNWGDRIIWSKGHTKTTDVRLLKLGASVSMAKRGKYKGVESPFYGKHHTEESKKLLSELHKHFWQDPKYRQVMSDKMSEGSKRMWANPSKRARRLALMEKTLWTPEAKRHRSETRKGERNPSWAGGKSFEPYTKDFNDELKSLIRMRDAYTCQLCGIPECETGELLVIHHIDYNKQLSLPSNLISLCRSCNAKVNKGREYWEEYFKNVLNERQLDPKALRTSRKWRGKKVKIVGGGIFVYG